MKISVCMITFDNERTVARALESVKAWADEIIVVDSFSSDSTPEIVKNIQTISSRKNGRVSGISIIIVSVRPETNGLFLLTQMK